MDEEGLRRNAILASLPGNGLAALASEAEVVSAELRMQVYQPGSTIDTVYFPLASVFSLVGVTDERAVIEVATVGREGMVGLPVFLGAVTTPHAAFCQVGGPAAKLSADGLRRALAGEANGALHDALNRFTQATMVQIAQNVVCNSTHPAIQRAARWLLTTRDRLGSAEFPLTQEFLSQMLGLRRPTVSHTARQLQEAGLIRYSRGNLTITDPRGLEKAACSCYAIVRAEFDLITEAG